MRRSLLSALVLAIAWVPACAPSGGSLPSGGVAAPGATTALPTGHRLDDIHAQPLARDGRVVLFLCRWSTEKPIPIALPLDSSDAEQRAIDDVLRAWENAGLGVRFVRVEGGRTSINLEWYDESVSTPSGLDVGNTVTDCLVRENPGAEGATLRAELVSATVRISRQSAPLWRGEARPLSPEELRGVLLHELGHALGFSGHAKRGDTVMVAEVEAIRRAGASLLAGEAFRDATLEALYKTPNGQVLRREAVEPWRTDRVDRMAALAERNDLAGPYLRTGETRSRVYWVTERGDEYGLVLVNLVETLRRPDRALVAPEARTRRALPRSRDRGEER